MADDDSPATGLAGRLARRLATSVSALVVAAVQRWAWSSVVVPALLALVALVAYLLQRHSRHARLGAALDSALVTADAALDPDPTGAAKPWEFVSRFRHTVIHLLTRGAVSRRGGFSDAGGALPAAPAVE